MMRAALIGFAIGATVGAGVTWRAMDQSAEVAALQRQLVVQQEVAAQASLARAVADAERDRLASVAEEYQSVKDALREGNFDDPLPAEFRDLILDVLRVGTRSGFDGPIGIP